MIDLFSWEGKMFDFLARPLIGICFQNSCWPIYSCLRIFICELRTSVCRIPFSFSNMQKHNLALKWKDPNSSSKMGFIPKQLKNCQELWPLTWTCFPGALLFLLMLVIFSFLFKHSRYWYFINAFSILAVFPSGLDYCLSILICLQTPQWVRERAQTALTMTPHDIVSLPSLVGIF